MKKNYFLLLFFLGIKSIFAQVGINTTTPNAQLEIRSSNQTSPSNTDGILIPKIDIFPATNPTAAQQGMMVYLTTASGTNMPGFYYWDNAGTPSWRPITGSSGSTLDQAYDFGGAGNGRTITADAGAVTITGTDGFVSTGTLGSGVIAPSGAGTRIVWNPRKAAFRAGTITGTQWDDSNIGSFSTAFGNNTVASSANSTAFGQATTANGLNCTAFGVSTTASAGQSTAFGNNTGAIGLNSTSFGWDTVALGNTSTSFGRLTTASGFVSTAFGQSTSARGQTSAVMGYSNTAESYGEIVLGIGSTNYTPSTNGATQFRTANTTDRLLVVGNAIDANNNSAVDTSERSDALIILKNGLTRLPSTTNAMINAADGKAVVTKEYLQNTTSGTLDQAYDFGGAGIGNTITADAGALTINGTDGFVSTGTLNTGAVAPSGDGVKMFWNPRKAAFRAGSITGTQWDDATIGTNSIAFGNNTIASGFNSTAFGSSTTASGIRSTAFGSNNQASGLNSTALGSNAIASGFASTAFGSFTTASGNVSTTFGAQTIASGTVSTAFGSQNTAPSYGETVLGIGATIYTPSTNGNNEFTTANTNDRLLVVGNAIDANNNTVVDTSERSDALIILKNGLTRLPSSTNAMINAADGKAVVTKEWVEGNTATSWGLTGNAGINPSTNFIGTTDDQDVVFRRNNEIAGRIGGTNSAFGRLALFSNTFGGYNNAFGIEALRNNTLGYYNNAFGSNALRNNSTGSSNCAFGNVTLFNNSTGSKNSAFGDEALRLNSTGEYNCAFGCETLWENTTGINNVAMGFQALFANTVGINNVAVGTQALDVNTVGNNNTAIGTSALSDNVSGDSNTAVGHTALFNSTGNNNTALGRGALSGVTSGSNNTAIGFNAQVSNNLGSNQVRIGNTAVAFANVQVPWNITSDSRWKTNIKPSNLGLDFIKELHPVFYTRKDVAINEGKTTILETTSNPTTEYGFIAQDLESALLKFGATNNGIISKDDEGMYGVRYNDLLAPMVKAIQEQQVIIEELKAKIEKLENGK